MDSLKLSCQKLTFDHIWANLSVTTQKGLLNGIELVTFFGNSKSPLQYSVVGDTPQTSHKSQHSIWRIWPHIIIIGHIGQLSNCPVEESVLEYEK